MLNILLIVHFIIGLLLLISILLQKTSSDSITNLAGNNSGLISAQGAANFLTKTTIVLAAAFMINAIVLANLSTRKSEQTIQIEKNIQQEKDLPIAK